MQPLTHGCYGQLPLSAFTTTQSANKSDALLPHGSPREVLK